MLVQRADDRIVCRLVRRFGDTRQGRYVFNQQTEGCMPSIIKELLEFFTMNKICSEKAQQFILESAVLSKGDSSYRKGLIGLFNGQYVVTFIGAEGLDVSMFKITHNDKEKELFDNFLFIDQGTNFDALFMVCLRILRDKQRARMIKGLPTEGILYSSYPEEDVCFAGTGFIQYITQSLVSGVAFSSGINATSNAISRCVSREEIQQVFPEDDKAALFAREFSDLEVAQLNALEPGIASRV